MLRRLILAMALGAACGPAVANDTPVSEPMGGLRLQRSKTVSMVREDLDISDDWVRVRYVFRNNADHDEQLHVAFPLPDVFAGSESPHSTEPTPVGIDFRVTVDGRAISPSLEQRAFLHGKDVTETLKRFGYMGGVDHELTDDETAEIKRLGLIDDDRPQWTEKATYHWDQAFPTGRDVVVEHTYHPVTGTGGVEDKDLCVDKATADGIEAIKKAGDKAYPGTAYLHFHSAVLDYVLMTARNWSGPIGTFHLTIRKPSPRSIVSTYLQGLEKTGATTFELTRQNFVPERDLKVLFVVHPEGLRPTP